MQCIYPVSEMYWMIGVILVGVICAFFALAWSPGDKRKDT